jgi:ABC-type nitrate/sulfonate/bicarbonate transport system substrate-binding protein
VALAAAQLETVTIGFSSFSGFYGPLWLAVEDQLGRKHGLDLKAVYAGRVRPQQLLASGEVPLVVASGSGAVTSHVLGVKDQVIVALMSNKVGGGIFAKPEIKRPEDLKGKLMATGHAGGRARSYATGFGARRGGRNLVDDSSHVHGQEHGVSGTSQL